MKKPYANKKRNAIIVLKKITKEKKQFMNQILVTEKLYVTPEIKRKKFAFKIEFFLSVFLLCTLFSYYIYAAYDRNKAEEVSQQILAELKSQTPAPQVDTTIKDEKEDKVMIIFLTAAEEKEHELEVVQVDTTTSSYGKKQDNTELYASAKVYQAEDGTKYIRESILKIPSIGVEYAVLSETSPELLFVSLNKYWGPKPNEVGNYCIVGHYYESGYMFGKLHKLKNGDTAQLTDLSGRTVTYQVYNKYIVEPTDTKCTSQLTNGRRELTLITCTNHGKQRLVVKLREI